MSQPEGDGALVIPIRGARDGDRFFIVAGRLLRVTTELVMIEEATGNVIPAASDLEIGAVLLAGRLKADAAAAEGRETARGSSGSA